MEDLYIKPGNQERGWNDPPQFSYGLQAAQTGPKRNLLNKRVPPPQLTGSQSTVPPPAHTVPPMDPLAPPPCGKATPPRLCPSVPVQDASPGLSENEPDVSEIVKLLIWALTACRETVKKQICDDVARRVNLFEEMWRDNKLSLPVKRRMSALAEEMKNHNWDRADEIHRSLMVDHVNEVSQWMVGVKRLIAEARNVKPELLKQEANPGPSECEKAAAQ